MYNATTEIGNIENNLLPFRGVIAKLSIRKNNHYMVCWFIYPDASYMIWTNLLKTKMFGLMRFHCTHINDSSFLPDLPSYMLVCISAKVFQWLQRLQKFCRFLISLRPLSLQQSTRIKDCWMTVHIYGDFKECLTVFCKIAVFKYGPFFHGLREKNDVYFKLRSFYTMNTHFLVFVNLWAWSHHAQTTKLKESCQIE